MSSHWRLSYSLLFDVWLRSSCVLAVWCSGCYHLFSAVIAVLHMFMPFISILFYPVKQMGSCFGWSYLFVANTWLFTWRSPMCFDFMALVSLMPPPPQVPLACISLLLSLLLHQPNIKLYLDTLLDLTWNYCILCTAVPSSISENWRCNSLFCLVLVNLMCNLHSWAKYDCNASINCHLMEIFSDIL